MELEIMNILFPFLGALLGSLITVIGQVIINRENKISSKKKFQYTKICKQYATFCKLENLYVEEIVSLRKQLNKDNKPRGVQNEFRSKVYEDLENERITFNDSSIQTFYEV